MTMITILRSRRWKASTTAAFLLLTGASDPAPMNVAVSQSDDAAVNRAVEKLISQMTPEEKVGQLTNLFLLDYGTIRKDLEAGIAKGDVGNVLFVTDPVVANRLQNIALTKTRLRIPLLFGFDVIHGLTTIFPVPIGAAASWDPSLVERSQAVAAAEARSVGIGWTFAPNVDISRDPRWGRIVEGAGEDPYLGSVMAAAQVRGFQGAAIGNPNHVIAGAKHFAGYGASLGGRDYDEANISDADLWNVYLPPFKATVDAGVGSIMSAYMPVNGVPSTGSRWLLTDVLRKEWGFNGFVVSDNNAVKDLQKHGFASDLSDAAGRALGAGVDMEMATSDPASPRLVELLAAGRISAQRLDDAVRLVLTAKFRMGLFKHPYVDTAKATRALARPEYLVAARVAAERSAVLLRNEGSVLPLNAKRLNSVAVIGPLAGSAADALGPWVFKQNHPRSSSILDGIRNKVGSRVDVVVAQGVNLPKRMRPSPFVGVVGDPHTSVPNIDETAGIARAVEAARAADVSVLVVGEGQDMVGEVASKSSLDLPGRQQELLEAVVGTGKPVVVVLMNGRPLDLHGAKPAAILEVWYPGSAAGASTANLLFGDAVPGGKLPFTWPRNASQLPLYYSHLTTMDPVNADRRYWNDAGGAVYPFGHGLSYTTFTFSKTRVEPAVISPSGTVTVSVDVTNTGERMADQVAQLYIHQRSGTSARPVRELKGFERVALRPGETRTLSFTLGTAELRYWNAESHAWVVDESIFDVTVGGDSTASFATSFKVGSHGP